MARCRRLVVGAGVPLALTLLVSRLVVAVGAIALAARRDDGETTATTTLPTDLASIAARFQQIDAQIEALGPKVTELEAVEVQVEAAANSTSSQLNQTEQDIDNVSAMANQNAAVAHELQTRFANSSVAVEAAAAQLKTIKEAAGSIEQDVLELSTDSAELGRKVGQLTHAMNDVLPGRASVQQRLERAASTLAKFKKQAEAGRLNPIVATKLRAAFRRAAARTDKLAEDVLRARMEGADDTSADAEGKDVAS